MNLQKLQDAAVDYKNLAKSFPENIYFVIASKVIDYLSKTPSFKGISVPFNEKKLFGNNLTLFVDYDLNASFEVNGVKFNIGNKKGVAALKEFIKQLFKHEMQVNHKLLNRPEGHNIKLDRSDFKASEASGTFFPQLYDGVKYIDGVRSDAILGGERPPIINEPSFEIFKAQPSFHPEKYEKYSNDFKTIYYKKSIPFIDLTGKEVTEDGQNYHKLNKDDFHKLLYYPDRSYALLARNPDLSFLSDIKDKYIVMFEDEPFFLRRDGGNTVTVKPYIK